MVNPLLIISVALYTGSIALLIIVWKSPLSWHSHKTEVTLPSEDQEIQELANQKTPHTFLFSIQSQEVVKNFVEKIKTEDVRTSEVSPECECGIYGLFLEEHLKSTNHKLRGSLDARLQEEIRKFPEFKIDPDRSALVSLVKCGICGEFIEDESLQGTKTVVHGYHLGKKHRHHTEAPSYVK